MCSEDLPLTYITICKFTCSFICRNDVVFGVSAISFYVGFADFINYIVWHTIYCLYLGRSLYRSMLLIVTE